VLVLGGGSDIAATTVDRLVGDRCRTVILAARRPDELTPLVERFTAAGATRVEAVGFDALQSDQHADQIAGFFKEFGDIDLVLVAFGVLGAQADFDADPAAAATAVTANYVGAVSSGLAVANELRHQGHGVLAVLSSVAGERARSSNFVYGSSNAGLDAFAQGLGDSLVGSGARVMIVRPGFVHTTMTKGLKVAPMATTPEAVADAIVDGLRKDREIVWVPAKLRWVFAVMRHLPRPVWRKVSEQS